MRSILFAPVLLLLPAVRLAADVRLPCVFSDHMVLTRAQAVPVWGDADPGEEVVVTFEGKTVRTTAGTSGKWMVHLDLMKSGQGPSQMVVKGKNEVVISDVLVGTAWLASGQSNMEHPLRATIDADAEIARSSNPLFRQIKIGKVMSAEPKESCKGQWTIASPETSGAYTAVGYYFGKRLQKELQEPVGIVDASWGGTFSELWISSDAINRTEPLRSGDAAWRRMASEYPAQKQAYVEAFAAWLRTNGREDRPCLEPARFAGETVATEDWSRIRLPGKISPVSATGAFWMRKDIEAPDSFMSTGQDFKVMLGPLEGFEQVYWNGTKVSETPYEKLPGQGYPRYFTIPRKLLRVGRNTMAVRIYAPGATPVIPTNPDAFNAGPMSMVGEWLVKTEYEFAPIPAAALASLPKSPVRPLDVMASSIFNGVVNPVIPYGIAGALWYQGESNAGRAYEYRTALRLLIEDWREKWKRSDLPFYICQLPSSGPKNSSPGESDWAELRESQATVLKLPNTAMAVLVDLGEAKDLHLRNKKEIGERLARLVLSRQYGKDLVSSGPVYESMTVEDNQVRIRFLHADGGLAAKPLPAVYDVSTLLGQTAPLMRNSPRSELEGFQICGEDRRWFWADARIDGGAVVVSSNQVPHPIAVRYAWADSPTANLANGAGLPAAPFRTDDFPARTAKNHFGPNR